MKVYCYKDHKQWGERFGLAWQSAGFVLEMFSEASEVPDEPNLVYMMTHHNPVYREHDKNMMKELASKKNIILIPSLEESRLYDDKVAQYKVLSPVMPKSYEILSRYAGYQALNEKMIFPFISKSAMGAASSNVRLIKGVQQAGCEIEQAFGDGIKRHYGLMQKGYLFWQEFLDGNAYQYKVIVMNNCYAFIYKVINRKNEALASGSMIIEKVTEKTDEIKNVLIFASGVAEINSLIFTGMDIIFEYPEKRPRLLEITTDWGAFAAVGCTVFRKADNGWYNTKRIIQTEQEMFDLMPLAWSNYGNG